MLQRSIVRSRNFQSTAVSTAAAFEDGRTRGGKSSSDERVISDHISGKTRMVYTKQGHTRQRLPAAALGVRTYTSHPILFVKIMPGIGGEHPCFHV